MSPQRSQSSARHRQEHRLGTVMAEIVVDVAGNEVAAAITRHSAEALDLKAGDEVSVVIKATEVMIDK